jgi:hypothetical protein
MQNRLALINEIINIPKDLPKYITELWEFTWDYEGDKILMWKQHILKLFAKYRDGYIDYDYLTLWADILELRDEIEYEAPNEDIISEILSILSSPEINGKLTESDIDTYIKRLL